MLVSALACAQRTARQQLPASDPLRGDALRWRWRRLA
jgi:hypothetical protein